MFILILETKCFVTEKNLTHRLGPIKAEEKMRQIIIFLLLCVFVTCDGLKCFCNEIVGCDGNVCLTDGTCRTWIKKMGDSGVKHGYQCLDKNKLFPPESHLLARTVRLFNTVIFSSVVIIMMVVTRILLWHLLVMT